MKLKFWEIISSSMVFDHQWYQLRKDVVKLPDGKLIDDYFVSVRKDVVIVFAVTNDFEVILVRQYKHGIQQIVTELPGGFIDDNEKPEEAALRELLEETGYSAESIELVSTFFDNPTKDTNTINAFIARNAVKTTSQKLDPTEDIEVLIVSLEELERLVKSGVIKTSASVAFILLALDHLKR